MRYRVAITLQDTLRYARFRTSHYIKARDIIHRYPIIWTRSARCSVYLITRVTYVMIFSRERRRRLSDALLLKDAFLEN